MDLTDDDNSYESLSSTSTLKLDAVAAYGEQAAAHAATAAAQAESARIPAIQTEYIQIVVAVPNREASFRTPPRRARRRRRRRPVGGEIEMSQWGCDRHSLE